VDTKVFLSRQVVDKAVLTAANFGGRSYTAKVKIHNCKARTSAKLANADATTASAAASAKASHRTDIRGVHHESLAADWMTCHASWANFDGKSSRQAEVFPCKQRAPDEDK
jgi:hypothetical protein